MAVGNRKERRAAAQKNAKIDTKASGNDFKPSDEIDADGVELLLQHPDRAGPKGKSLFDLADERQRELNKERGIVDLDKDNTPPGEQPFDDEPIGPFGDAILYAFSMATLHLTLDVIVYTQYREEILWLEIFKRAGIVFPVFLVVVYLLHAETTMRFPTARNIFFLGVSVSAGCYMVYNGNVNGYYHIMQRAPPIGALWIWSVVEMQHWFALANIIIVASYLLWNGFEAF